MRLIAILLLFPSVGLAANFTVSDGPPPPIKLSDIPPEIRQLPPREFFKWAREQNARQKSECEVRAATQRADGMFKPQIKHVSTITSKSSGTGSSGTLGTTRLGGLGGLGFQNGYGGYFGGSPLYAGTLPLGSAGYSNSGGYGGGYFARQGQSSQSTSTATDYDISYKDFNDDGGGPLSIINPYCWEYWTQQ